jgi:hypothetical protein
VAAHIARLSLDQKEGEGYEVRREPRNFGAASTVAIGLVRGPAVYREI